MLRSLWPALVPCALGACTIVYNSDNLPPPTDAADAREIDAQPIDADPSQLTLTAVEPAALFEGTGGGGGRPALVVLRGTSLVGDATVTAAFTTGADVVEVAGFDAAPDGTEAGVALRIPVVTDLAAGAQRTLRLTVTQGQVAQSIDLMVQGLDELRLSGPTTAASAAPARYSRIEVVGNVHVTGTAPLRLEATADIHLTAKLDGNAQGAAPGPGGCTGGAAEGAGNCTPGGGGAGVNGATLGLGTGGGGGGGGFGAAGTAGTGMGAGGVGMATGNDMLVPLVGGVTPDESNRGNGGGGGGGGALGAAGGAGAGGGGTIALTAGGDVLVEGAGRVEATGGTSNGGSGGGGGGSGGAILIRAGGALTAPGVWLAAAGGGASTGAGNAGGPGGVGRIRVDSAGGGLAAMATTPVAVRGPAWALATPVVAAALPSVTLTGEPGRALQIRVNDAAAPSATPGIDGTVAITGLAWRRGKNQLCAVARTDRLVAESLACVDVYLTAP